VAHLKPGNMLDSNTLDCFGNAIQKPGDTKLRGGGLDREESPAAQETLESEPSGLTPKASGGKLLE
jgi:hypothetical protein